MWHARTVQLGAQSRCAERPLQAKRLFWLTQGKPWAMLLGHFGPQIGVERNAPILQFSNAPILQCLKGLPWRLWFAGNRWTIVELSREILRR